MTRINLLPEEYRPLSETPAVRRYSIYIGVFVVGVLLSVWGGYGLFRLPAARNTAEALSSQRQAMEPKLEKYDGLVAQIGAIENHRIIIAELWKRRIIWSRKLAQLKSIVPGYVWLQELQLKPAKRQQVRTQKGMPQSRGELVFRVTSATVDIDNMTNFFRILTGVMGPMVGPQFIASPDVAPSVEWARDFVRLAYGRINREDFDQEVYVEKVGWKTDITMYIRPVKEPAKKAGGVRRKSST